MTNLRRGTFVVLLLFTLALTAAAAIPTTKSVLPAAITLQAAVPDVLMDSPVLFSPTLQNLDIEVLAEQAYDKQNAPLRHAAGHPTRRSSDGPHLVDATRSNQAAVHRT